MTLNLQASRRLSLGGFAIGWDDCYLIVKAVNGSDAEESAEKIAEFRKANDVKALNRFVRDYCIANVTRGVVMNTLNDGTAKPYEFSSDEVPAVIDALNFAWQLEVLSISTGTDRLKA